MTKRRAGRALLAAATCVWIGSWAWSEAGQVGRGTMSVPIDPDDIGGVVTGANGPEAGVWVIAETSELPTRLRKIVVTDDRGRYVLPDLPKATFKVWVRGYGLVDSRPVDAVPGKTLNLRASAAPTPVAAAEYYPGDSWISMLKIPGAREFPGTGPSGNGIATTMHTQAEWIDQLKDGCMGCHHLGNKATRGDEADLISHDSSIAAWEYRLRKGGSGANMIFGMGRFGDRGFAMFADWTDRIAAGEVPPAPPRPQDIERNLVLTMWDWAETVGFVHSQISTDKRHPTVNANGPVYGAASGLAVVDPVNHTAWEVPVPVREERMTARAAYGQVTGDRGNPHTVTIDGESRVWMPSVVRSRENPDVCKEGSSNPFARYFPLTQSVRQASVYDPRTKKVTLIDTCFQTHHVQFAEDRDQTLYFSGDTDVIGWINTRVFDRTGDALAAQGWCPIVLDTNGDGKITEYVPWAAENRQSHYFTDLTGYMSATLPPGSTRDPIDPTKDRRIAGFAYGIVVNPVDGAVWFATPGVPGRIVRLEVGSNPPASCKAELYEPPFNPESPGKYGYSPRGIDIDRNGVVWTALSGSSHMASFDRRKCTVLNGPTALGQHCTEGWTLYPTPGPRLKGSFGDASAGHLYYNWVDQFDTLGLGKNVPIAAGTGTDALLALLPDIGKFVVLRVPYPLAMHMRGMDGRIDDPQAGWKGRGLWANFGSTQLRHIEGGRGAIVKFQLRPDPLAK